MQTQTQTQAQELMTDYQASLSGLYFSQNPIEPGGNNSRHSLTQQTQDGETNCYRRFLASQLTQPDDQV